MNRTRPSLLLVTIACGCLVALASANPRDLSAQASPKSAVEFLRASAAPADYVLSRFASHKVVLMGEAHWVKHDVDLLANVVSRLPESNVNTFAAEWLPAREQQHIDSLINSREWNQAAAVSILRAAAWPYREYLNVLHEAWAANRRRGPGKPELKVLALGPEPDWRKQLLPLGKTYDSYMAELVIKRIEESPQNRVLVGLGFHHAFTRYLQPDLPGGSRATRFNDRTGNVLWRALGENVFMIVLHHPWYCRSGTMWGRCLPLDGAVDCAAISAGGHPVGFDIANSPFAEMRIEPGVWYSAGYPFLRFDALADGYVWTQPIDSYANATLLPLDVFAPDEKSLGEVLANNPVSDAPAKTRDELAAQWKAHEADLANALVYRHWDSLGDWRGRCPH
ncbi:MAG TPA: hypothetical protein VD758_04950 [Gemmatimonadaceae bacterium]|nr:hypothetical protein [Gemmatimonadaceae bacterium]